MAVIRKIIKNKTYEVRRAGNSLRLYTNGVFHSQFNSNFPLGGNVWDLLVLPALFMPQSIQRVLVLGVGGGAVIRALDQLLGTVEIVGLELDPVHVAIAKQQFGLARKRNVQLLTADAVDWVKNYRGPAFDLIVDDLYSDEAGEPRRAVPVDEAWASALCAHLSPRGALVLNFESTRALRNSALSADPKWQAAFASRFSLSAPGYENRMGAFFREPVSKADLQASLRDLEQRLGKSATRRLTARIRAF